MVAGVCLDVDTVRSRDAQIGRAAAILDRQRALGFAGDPVGWRGLGAAG
jgi:hypothetical protein